MSCDFWSTLIGAAIGLAGSLAISWYYNRVATAELVKETAELRRLHQLTILALANREAKWEPSYSNDGKTILGIRVPATLHGSISFSGAAVGGSSRTPS